MKKIFSLIILVILSVGLTGCWPFDKKTKENVSSPGLLKSLEVVGATLSPAFSSGTLNYEAIVPFDTEKVIINAEAQNTETTIEGNKEYTLTDSVTEIKVITKYNGVETSYIIRIGKGIDPYKTVNTEGNIEDINTNVGLKVISGMYEAQVESNGTYKLAQNDNTVQLAQVINAKEEPVMMAVNVIGESGGSTEISAESTAEALVFMMPFICTTETDDAKKTIDEIKNLSSFSSLVNIIKGELNDGRNPLDSSNEKVMNQLLVVVGDALKKLENTENSKISQLKNQLSVPLVTNKNIMSRSITSLGSQSFVEVLKTDETSNEVKFKIRNKGKRYIDIYADVEGETSSLYPVEQLTSPSYDAIDNLIDNGFGLGSDDPYLSDEITIQKNIGQIINLNIYGIGIGGISNFNDGTRLIQPMSSTLIMDILIPVFDVAIGIKSEKPTRVERPNKEALYKLLMKCSNEFAEKTSNTTDIYNALINKDLSSAAWGLVKGIGTSFISTTIDSPKLVGDVLIEHAKNKLGASALKFLTGPFAIVFKVSDSLQTGINLAWTLTSALTCEAKSTFKLTNEVPIANDLVFVEKGTAGNSGISVDKSFYIQKYEVTQGQFEKLTGYNPSYFRGIESQTLVNNPVEQVTWYDAVMYANKLSVKEGLLPYYTITSVIYSENPRRITSATVTENTSANGYRLPTEQEWEYAARGGNKSNNYTYAGSNSVDEVAWYNKNSNSKSQIVGQKKSNELGIYDMSGNIWEKTNTSYFSSYIRLGSSWGDSEEYAQVSFNLVSDSPNQSHYAVGFRLVRPY